MSNKKYKVSEEHFIKAFNQADEETQSMIEAFITWAFNQDVMLSDETLASEYMRLCDFIHLVASENARKDYIAHIKSTLHNKIITLPNRNEANTDE